MRISQLINCLQRFKEEDFDDIEDVNIDKIVIGKNEADDGLEVVRVMGKYFSKNGIVYAKALAVK